MVWKRTANYFVAWLLFMETGGYSEMFVTAVFLLLSDQAWQLYHIESQQPLHNRMTCAVLRTVTRDTLYLPVYML